MPTVVRCGTGLACGTVDRVIHVNVSRLRRALLAASIAAAVAVPLSEAARPSAVPAPVPAASASPLSEAARPSAVPAPVPTAADTGTGSAVPTALPTTLPTTGPTTGLADWASPRPATSAALAARYAAVRGDIVAAERMAAGHGHRRRAAMLHAMAEPARRLLSFDGRDGGRAAEVFGDLASAEHLAVLVPGGDTHLDKYGLLRGGALRLSQALGDRSAVIAWLGYRTPNTVSLAALTTGRADEAAPALRAFVRELTELRPVARVTLVCHSYGSVVCGRAAPGLDVAGMVLIGSPGVTAGDAAALRTPATVWAGRGSRDWIAGVPHLRLRLPYVTVGFGADPVAPGFGARVFAAGDGGHSDYFRAGSPSLTNIARIVSGQPPAEVRSGR